MKLSVASAWGPCRKISAVIAVSATCLGGAAEASLVAGVQQASSGQIATTVLDTQSGLSWLAVSATARQTFSQAETGVWAALGYRHASSVELLGLISNAGVDLSRAWRIAGVPAPGTFNNQSDVLSIYGLIRLLGPTGWSNQPSQGDPYGQPTIYGFLSDERFYSWEPLPGHFYSYLSATGNVAAAELHWGEAYSDVYDSQIGNFMVRMPTPVPEPGALMLALIGLVNLRLSRRKR